MLRLFLLAAMPLTMAAELSRRHGTPQMGTEECCPCPAADESSPKATETVYLTADPAATSTVTVERTVTEPATTVYLTKNAPEPVTVTKDSELRPHPAQQTVTVVRPSDEDGSDNMDDAPGPGHEDNDGSEDHQMEGDDPAGEDGPNEKETGGPRTVTVKVNANSPKTITISQSSPQPTDGGEHGEMADDPEVVTVTAPYHHPSGGYGDGSDGDKDLIETVFPDASSHEDQDDLVKTITVKLDNSKTIVQELPITVTQNVEHGAETGAPDADIDSHSNDYIQPDPTQGDVTCDPVEASTTIETVYNTVHVTVEKPSADGSAAPVPTMARRSTRDGLHKRSWWLMPAKA